MQMEMLIPRRATVSPEEFQAYLAEGAEVEPFHASVVDVAADLSRRIFKDAEARKYPELLALAYWTRKAELQRLTDQYHSLRREDRFLVPRGIIFHLPPRNVDTMFVYSWLLALLTGNRNIIRLSSQRSESTNVLLRLVSDALANAPGSVRDGTVIVSYGHEEALTNLLSAVCDVRVIWGGDGTVATIRRSPLPPHAREITFPDRYSMAAIQARSYEELPEERRQRLVEQFFNDSYWFDQMACSSPRLVIWCGQPSQTKAASRDFFSRLAAHVARTRYSLPAAASIHKLAFACSAVLDLPVTDCQWHPGLIVLTLDSLAGFQRTHPGGGMFFEVHLERLLALAPMLQRRDQTLTWFGFKLDELHTLIRNLNGRALDRLVPIGQALQFHRFWDGYDLLQEFCRQVYIE
jgi:hypothetical protein